MFNATLYEDELNNKTSSTYKDLYCMQPAETHAHGLQEYMEHQFMEKPPFRNHHMPTPKKPDMSITKLFYGSTDTIPLPIEKKLYHYV